MNILLSVSGQCVCLYCGIILADLIHNCLRCHLVLEHCDGTTSWNRSVLYMTNIKYMFTDTHACRQNAAIYKNGTTA